MYAALLFLLSFLLPLPYDGSRRVGDVAMIELDRWKHTLARPYSVQSFKVGEMRQQARAQPNDQRELAEEEALFERIKAAFDALESAQDYLYSLGYRSRPPLDRRVVLLLDLPYDGSRRVGDVAVTHLHEWTLMVSRASIEQWRKLEQLKSGPKQQDSSTGGDEVAEMITEQEKLVNALHAAEQAGASARTVLLMWGYRRPSDPAPAASPPPERK
jgi:hypothetical protein